MILKTKTMFNRFRKSQGGVHCLSAFPLNPWYFGEQIQNIETFYLNISLTSEE